MKMKYGKRIASLFMTMLIVSMFAVVPATACVPGGTCGERAADEDIIAEGPVNLEGKEKEELLSKALADESLLEVKEELQTEGYVEKNVETYSLGIKAKDGSVVHAKVAAFTFESANGDINDLTYIYNEETGESFVARGLYGCPQCLALIVLGGFGCTAVCVTGGVLTMGALCIACLAAVATASLCPCYVCACSNGLSTGCQMASQYGC
ncbi:hypothetical protein [Methanolobus sp. WCC5]|uniref:hypothetical protein n=1 Tax=Methanolobus sp. WCC5 TaxID=3125785 RepID=UPI003245664A